MADRTTFFIIDRAVFQNEAINSKPFDDFHAWIYLIGKANYADRIVRHRGQIQKVSRGSMVTSYGFLASEWGWSYNKTRRYIRQLERLSMLQVESTPLGITLTIENYAKFQDVRQGHERTDERPNERPNERTDERQKNKVNNENKGNKRESSARAFDPPTFEDVQDYVLIANIPIDPETFYSYYEANGWMVGTNPMKNWKAAVNAWARRERSFTAPKGPRKSAAESNAKLDEIARQLMEGKKIL